MQAIDQTTFGEGLGYCFSACVASILELPIEEVPFFGADELWWTRFAEWLEARNLYAICLKHRLGRAPVGYHILSGKSPRGEFMHSVVAKGEDIVHDPHPSRATILDRVDCIVIVPMDFGDHKRELATLRERVAKLEALGPWIEANRLAELRWADEADARGDVNRGSQRMAFEARADAFKQCGYELNNRAGKDLRAMQGDG